MDNTINFGVVVTGISGLWQLIRDVGLMYWFWLLSHTNLITWQWGFDFSADHFPNLEIYT